MGHDSKITTDHDEIRRWAEARGAKPSRVKGTGSERDPGLIRLNFPGYDGEETLEDISWEEFFTKFDDNNLAFLFQEETIEGERSNFSKLISRETAHQRSEERDAA